MTQAPATPSQFANRYGGAALITGASSGFGADFARALASDGMDVILVARRKPLLDELAAEIQATHNVKALVVAQDLTAPGADAALAKHIDEAGLAVGLLINNAGFGAYSEFLDLDADFQARMVDLNCRVPVVLTHRFVPDMVERGRGAVIIVASVAAYQPTPYFATYGATKAFDLMLGEALWVELTSKGIDVLTVSPGYVATGFQAVANSSVRQSAGQELTSPEVVAIALKALGKKPSVVPGVFNKFLAAGSRFAPRSWVARVAGFVTKSKATPSGS